MLGFEQGVWDNVVDADAVADAEHEAPGQQPRRAAAAAATAHAASPAGSDAADGRGGDSIAAADGRGGDSIAAAASTGIASIDSVAAALENESADARVEGDAAEAAPPPPAQPKPQPSPPRQKIEAHTQQELQAEQHNEVPWVYISQGKEDELISAIKRGGVEHGLPGAHDNERGSHSRIAYERDHCGATVLHMALLYRNNGMAKRIVQEFPESVLDEFTSGTSHALTDNSYTGEVALHIAIVNRDVEMVSFLLDSSGGRCRAHMRARAHAHMRMGGRGCVAPCATSSPCLSPPAPPAPRPRYRKRMLQARARGRFFSPFGIPDSALWGTRWTDSEAVQSYGASQHHVYYGQSPLGFAVCTDQEDILQALLDREANLAARDDYGNNVLHLCVVHELPEMYDFLSPKLAQLRTSRRSSSTSPSPRSGAGAGAGAGVGAGAGASPRSHGQPRLRASASRALGRLQSAVHDTVGKTWKVSTRILGRRTAPFHLSLFLTASRMVLPQDLSTDPNCALLGSATRRT